MRNYFEDAEYRRGILTKWNNLTLKSVMTSNEDKLVKECLQLLIKCWGMTRIYQSTSSFLCFPVSNSIDGTAPYRWAVLS
jgi:hypothetical protein